MFSGNYIIKVYSASAFIHSLLDTAVSAFLFPNSDSKGSLFISALKVYFY